MRDRKLIPALLFLVAFALYLRCQAPAVVPIDGPEFITAAWVLGNPHSPGYPIYTQLARGAQLLPMGDAAVRTGLLSALGGGLTVILLAALAGQWAGPAAGATTGIALLLSRAFWSECNSPEVYSLAMAAIAGVALLLERYQQRGDVRWLQSAVLLFTLGLGIHQMLVFSLPALIVLGWARPRIRRGWTGPVAVTMGAAILGASGQLYLPLRALSAPYCWENPRTLDRLLGLVTTRSFHGQRMVRSFQDLQENLANAGSILVEQLGWPGLALALLGLAATLQASRRRGGFLVLLWAAGVGAGTVLFNIPRSWLFFLPVFFLPSVLAQALAAGQAGGLLLRPGRRRLAHALLLAALALGGLVRGYHHGDLALDRLTSDWLVNTLESAPPHAALVLRWDEPFLMAYQRWVEHRRPDLATLHFADLTGLPERRLPPTSDGGPGLHLPAMPPIDPDRQPGTISLALGILQQANPARPVRTTFPFPGAPAGRGLLWWAAPGRASDEPRWDRYRLRGLKQRPLRPAPPEQSILDGYQSALLRAEQTGGAEAQEAMRFRRRAGLPRGGAPGLPP